MPQENGWATGAEYIEDNGNHCPYCGHDDPTYAGDNGGGNDRSYTCEKCGGDWKERMELVGWEDSNEEFHEDTTTIDRLEYAEKTMATLAKALQDIAALTTCEGTEAHDMAAQIQGICRLALEDGN